MTIEHVALALILQEYDQAVASFPSLHSAHEGWAVIKEELDELWEVVRQHPDRRNRAAMTREATQVAAMALRFLVDVCRPGQREERAA